MEEFASNPYRQGVERQITRQFSHVVVDLAHLEHMDSSCLGTLASLLERVRSVEAKYYLHNVSEFNREILHISGFLQLLSILEPGQLESLQAAARS